ncbi:hypothetical protein [Streptomyces sp. NRRL S-31]|uniref:hypothetical protein n=1 Tax=Streptomyces sp. NRRL S-31 TaxID=1463898 RepID=UPI000AAA7ACC|nr:hypothetical protein [Streptomyces sp. NRRL S-31]
MSTPPQSPQPADQSDEQLRQPGDPPQPTPHPNPQSPPPARPFYARPTRAGRPQPGHPSAQAPRPEPAPPVPPARGRKGAGRAVLWAAVGAAVASAAWAAGVLLGPGAHADAELGGYAAPADLCSGADYSSFRGEYTGKDTAPTHTALKNAALDESYCSTGLKKSGSSYPTAYLTTQLDLHRKTDPAAEFTAVWKNYADAHPGYDVDRVDDLGDEAYLVSQDTTDGTSSGALYATLAVRDGWVTYIMSFSSYLTSYDEDKDPPALADVTAWLKKDGRATLERLRR